MCNLYSITTNQEAIRQLFRVINRYVGNLPAMPGVFPDYPAPVVRNAGAERELVLMRWGMPPPPRTSGAAIDQHSQHLPKRLPRWKRTEKTKCSKQAGLGTKAVLRRCLMKENPRV